MTDKINEDIDPTVSAVGEIPTKPLNGHDDSEIRMAQADLYRAAKNAMDLHKMLKFVGEIEGWCQAKITLASDGLESVKNYIEYEMVSSTLAESQEPIKSKNTLATQLSAISAKVPQTSEAATAFSNALAAIADKLGARGTAWATSESELDHTEKSILSWIKGLPRPVNVSDMIRDGIEKFGSDLVAARKTEIKSYPKVDIDEDMSPEQQTQLMRKWIKMLMDKGMGRAQAGDIASKMVKMGIQPK